jgi:outer membrane immunogenic protein
LALLKQFQCVFISFHKRGFAMKYVLSATLGLLVLAAALPAAAADLPPQLPVYAPPIPVPYYSWTGFYIGGNVGGAWANGSVTDNLTGASWSTNRAGAIGGAQAGANLQMGNFVLGLESEFDWTALNGTGSAVGGFQGSANTTWMTTVAGRFGVAMDRLLLYGKAGGGWAQTGVSVTNVATGAAANASNIRGGWLLGGGLEYAIAPHWTTKLEYDYLGLQNLSFASPFVVGDSFNVNRNIQTVKFGINYKF